jgi:mannitol/fructose-specific phosphotransferase system IIA component (Ntr-type)
LFRSTVDLSMTENIKDHSSHAPTPFNVCHYLTPATITLVEGFPQKETLINQMIDRLSQVFHLSETDKIRQAVWEREKEGRTVLENGVAIPHARIAGLDEIKSGLTLIREGYRDPEEGILVRVIFLFLSPQEQFRSHLQLLAKISRIFQDTQFIEQLTKAGSSEEVFLLIQRKERVQD